MGISRIVVYIVSGKEHIEQAVRSSESIENYEAILATDNEWPPEFGAYLELPERQHNFWLLDRVRYFNYAFENIPFDQLLILDSDTYACDDITPFFDILNHVDIAGTHSIAQQTLYRDDIPQSFPELHCGALVFNRNERVKKLFEKWYEIYCSRPKYFGNDQPALRQALWEDKEIRLGVLPQEFCFRFRWGGLLARKVILLHGKEHKTSYEQIAKEVNTDSGIRVFHKKDLT